jgi:hypothetical protein
MKKKIWGLIHYLIIINLLVEIIYSMVMVFYEVGGGKWPLLGRAIDTPIEVILKRRLYGIEGWIALGTLCIYLALTVYLPAKLRENSLDNEPSAPF